MPTKAFRFKKFTVVQRTSAMKVGTDGVLLGAWFGVAHAPRRILDIGAGTGLIALMAAQRTEEHPCPVDAVEIDPAGAAEAAANAAASPWAERIEVINSSLQSFVRWNDTSSRYSHVVSNPPYFSDSLRNPDAARAGARHDVSLTHGELARAAAELLEDGGLFSVILPYEVAAAFIEMCSGCSMHLARRRDVYPTPGSPARRSLMEFVKGGPVAAPTIDSLTIGDGTAEGYTGEYMALTRDFYLKF